MAVKSLRIQNVGQIGDANVQFGDLTVLVGPQATGKSIFLQFLKLIVDTGRVQSVLKQHGLDWGTGVSNFLDTYLGEGMGATWRSGRSAIQINGDPVDLDKRVGRQQTNRDETLFFIPAQRVLTLGTTGWPRPFTDYSSGDPFCVRDFSETLRLQTEARTGWSSGEKIFPQTKRIKSEIRELLALSVFSTFGLRVDTQGSQKRFVLSGPAGVNSLPFMVWSAGQREFVPLLLGLYWLLPPTRSPRRGSIDWVVIEELETGLHPKAISVVLLLVLDLLDRGYRVCLSTHSPHVLDLVWALRVFREHRAGPRRLLDLFGVEASQSMKSWARAAMRKAVRVYLFERDKGRARDISQLDPGAEDPAEAGWGGLSEFSGRVAEAVADVVNGDSSGTR